VAKALALKPGDHVIEIARLRISDATPLAVQHSWIPFGLCPELWSEPLIDGSLYATLRDRYGVDLRGPTRASPPKRPARSRPASSRSLRVRRC
jgi:GntR family transcriptional regulator